MTQCIVFTIIGALWEFSSGSSGSSGIEVNPSKMDPWFPTPGSRMTVVFHKTPSNDCKLSRKANFAMNLMGLRMQAAGNMPHDLS